MYRCGFATTQPAYEGAVIPLFNSLDRLEKNLVGKDYLVGNQLTEADVRLFVTIVQEPHLPSVPPDCCANVFGRRSASTLYT